MTDVTIYDWEGYSQEFTVSGTAKIPIPGGGSVVIGGGESTDPYRNNPYGTYGQYPIYNQTGIAGMGIGTILLIAAIAFLLLKK